MKVFSVGYNDNASIVTKLTPSPAVTRPFLKASFFLPSPMRFPVNTALERFERERRQEDGGFYPEAVGKRGQKFDAILGIILL
jgi:hypothetical protein